MGKLYNKKAPFYGFLSFICKSSKIISYFVLAFPIILFCQELIEPKPYTVIDANVIRLKPKVPEGLSIKEVRFYAIYCIPTTIEPVKEMIGLAKKPPFYFYWNVSQILDQDMWRIQFFCDIVESSGKIISGKEKPLRHIILDRNPDYQKKIVYADFIKNMDSLIKDDSIIFKPYKPSSFKFGDNKLTFQVLWSKERLGIYIKVEDEYIYSSYHPDLWPKKEIWEDDFVGIMFDIIRGHSPIIENDDRIIRVSPKGYVTLFDHKIKRGPPDTAGIIKTCLKVTGKINDNIHPDTGYEILALIPFSYLGWNPEKSDTVGFNLFSTDKEVKGDDRLWASWSGASRLQAANPTEWGRLILSPEASSKNKRACRYIILVIILLGILVAVIKQLQRKRQKTSNLNNKEEDSKPPFVLQIENYINKEYSSSDFSLEITAKRFNFSKSYFGKHFKKLFNQTYSKYLNKVRIEEAKNRLLNTSENINQIAFGIGYDNFDTFLKAFKKVTGMNPSEFRAQGKGMSSKTRTND